MAHCGQDTNYYKYKNNVYAYNKRRCGVKISSRTALIIFVTAASFFAASPEYGCGAVEWKTLSGEHFIINYLSDESFAEDVSHKAEIYYRNIATDLGYPRYTEFWTWEKRVKIFIYPNHNSFLKATGQPAWSHGMADYNMKSISGYTGSVGFLDSVLPHEIAHLIFRDFVGFTGEIPLWLDEGVAQWGESEKRQGIKNMIKSMYKEAKLLQVKDMMKLDMYRLKSMNRLFVRPALAKKGSEPGTLFLTTEALVDLYYIEAVSLITFLIEKFGSYSFSAFCRALRNGDSVDRALKSAYPDHFRSLEEFESRWVEYLESL
jgi:hypothetical protein